MYALCPLLIGLNKICLLARDVTEKLIFPDGITKWTDAPYYISAASVNSEGLELETRTTAPLATGGRNALVKSVYHV